MELCFIIPVYNTAPSLLERCVQSILTVDIEHCYRRVLIVDDGSGQEVAEFCDFLCEKYEDVECIHQKNNGASSARNTGIENVKTGYIFFVDADDIVDAIGINKIILNEADLIFTDITVQKRKVKEVWSAFPNDNCEDIIDVLKKITSDGKLNGPVGKVISVTFLKKNNIRFVKGVVSGEDALFLMDMLLNNPVFEYQKVNTYYYYLDSITSVKRLQNNTTEVLNDIISVYQKMIILINSVIDNECVKIELLSKAAQRATKQLFNSCCELLLIQKIDRTFMNCLVGSIDGKYKRLWERKEKLQYFLLRYRLYGIIKSIAHVRKLYLERRDG